MSEQPTRLIYFATPQNCTVVALPFDLEATIAAWHALRRIMVRLKDPAFTREEWAYLITFVSEQNLRQVFMQAFGDPAPELRDGKGGDIAVTRVARPRGEVAIWLPNNVSLLGPLTMVLLTLTGNPIRMKGGSASEDLTGAFLAYVRANDTTSVLSDYLKQYVRYEVFGRDDPRNAEMAAEASMRIVFGADATAAAIHALPHPLGSVGFSNADRRSEAWIDASAATRDDTLMTLIRVFAIYGQAGCTSPSRVVLLDQTRADAIAFRDRLLDLWPQAGPRDVVAHLASSNVMAQQWAAGSGWDAALAKRNQAALVAGECGLPQTPSPMLLPIVAATVEQAVASLPDNIQTIGYALAEPRTERWFQVLASTRIKRFVPIGQMHHFGPVWDGEAYWTQAFELVPVAGDS